MTLVVLRLGRCGVEVTCDGSAGAGAGAGAGASGSANLNASASSAHSASKNRANVSGRSLFLNCELLQMIGSQGKK